MNPERLAVPASGGTEPPKMAIPAGATDCHHHIFDPAFPRPNGRRGIWGTVEEYRLLRRRLGLARSVITSPQSYEFDNTCLVDALDRLGETTRGVAAVKLDIGDTELDRLHAHGVRGIRLYLIGDSPTPPAVSSTTPDASSGSAGTFRWWPSAERRWSPLNRRCRDCPARWSSIISAT